MIDNIYCQMMFLYSAKAILPSFKKKSILLSRAESCLLLSVLMPVTEGILRTTRCNSLVDSIKRPCIAFNFGKKPLETLYDANRECVYFEGTDRSC